MENGTFVICMLVAMAIGYFVMKLLATKFFINLYNETGKNMITRPRQLLGFLTGIVLLLGGVIVASEGIMIGSPFTTALAVALTPLALTSIMFLTNRSVGTKKAIWCTVYQLALGLCFIGRLLVWIVEISLEIGGMICFGNKARFTWHPFFFTIINKDGTVSEKKRAIVVMNEDGSFEGGFKTATKIEAQMNSTRLASEQRYVENEIAREALERDLSISSGGSGVDEQQRIDELEREYDRLESQKKSLAG